MKKWLSLIMVVCMMLSTAALGEDVFVVQNELPPTLVTKTNAENKTVFATIYNAQDQMVAEILTDGSVILTDVHHRTSVDDETISSRLSSAYENVMDNVHHSDVKCELHDHDVKVDINMVLSSLNHEMNAHDLVMYEMFDVSLTEAYTALIPEGGYIELTLEIDSHQPAPLVVLYSRNGVDWSVIPYTSNGDQLITVRVPAPGTFALLCDGDEVMNIGKEEIPGNMPSDPTTGEGVTSGNFTPSVTGKLSPDLVVFTNGEAFVGTIRNKQGDVEIEVPNKNYIWVTATAERDYNYDIQTHEHLEWAFDGIKQAADVGDLVSDSHEGTIAADLDATLKEMGLDLTHDQLVVKDLFEVTAYGDYVHYLYDEDYYLEVTFTTDLDPQKPAVVIHSPDSVHWHIHPIEEAVVHEDGKITLRMYDLGTVAILVENPQLQMEAGELVTAP